MAAARPTHPRPMRRLRARDRPGQRERAATATFPGLRPDPAPPPLLGGSDAGGRGRAEEHVLPRRGHGRLHEPAHRRHGQRRDVGGLRALDPAARRPVRHPGAAAGCRCAPGLPDETMGRRRFLAPGGRRAAPPRPHRVGHGRARGARGPACHRHRVRRDGVRHGRHDLGWRGPRRRLRGFRARRAPHVGAAARWRCRHPPALPHGAGASVGGRDRVGGGPAAGERRADQGTSGAGAPARTRHRVRGDVEHGTPVRRSELAARPAARGDLRGGSGPVPAMGGREGARPRRPGPRVPLPPDRHRVGPLPRPAGDGRGPSPRCGHRRHVCRFSPRRGTRDRRCGGRSAGARGDRHGRPERRGLPERIAARPGPSRARGTAFRSTDAPGRATQRRRARIGTGGHRGLPCRRWSGRGPHDRRGPRKGVDARSRTRRGPGACRAGSGPPVRRGRHPVVRGAPMARPRSPRRRRVRAPGHRGEARAAGGQRRRARGCGVRRGCSPGPETSSCA